MTPPEIARGWLIGAAKILVLAVGQEPSIRDSIAELAELDVKMAEKWLDGELG